MNVNFFPFSNSLQILVVDRVWQILCAISKVLLKVGKKIYLLEIQCMIQEFIQLQQEKEIK